jgi:hypothetical protein
MMMTFQLVGIEGEVLLLLAPPEGADFLALAEADSSLWQIVATRRIERNPKTTKQFFWIVLSEISHHKEIRLCGTFTL